MPDGITHSNKDVLFKVLEKIEAVSQTDRNVRKEIGRKLLACGHDIAHAMQLTGLTRAEID